MPKNYVYRMTHDTGFAPNTKYGICSLSGCKNSKNGKRKNIEESAVKGSWVIGIGGNNTHQPNKLIYAMEIEENIPYSQFKKRYPGKSKYLQEENAGNNVLLSRKFYYFGKKAIDLPEYLKHIIIKTRNYINVEDVDVRKLKEHIEKCGYRKYGVFGKPNNKNAKNCYHQCGC